MNPSYLYKTTEKNYPEIMNIWEASVRATHHFLQEKDIQYYKSVLNDHFSSIDIYLLRNEFNQAIAFLGINKKHIEMLFIIPEERGHGWGKELICFAIHTLNTNTVDVNEQNVQAVGFYLKMGYEVISRDETDSNGDPYPILHLRLAQTPASVCSLKLVEKHPLGFYLPSNTKLLMLGSFPPKKERWSMNFYYPNIQNDMWRILGLLFFNNKEHFLIPGKKAFDEQKAKEFCNIQGIGIGDTADEVVRLKDNASDKFLEVIKPLDIKIVLEQIPECKAIVITGQKAMDTLLSVIPAQEPGVGEYTDFTFLNRHLRLYRMPSSSRAYPKPTEEKAAIYGKMFKELDFPLP